MSSRNSSRLSSEDGPRKRGSSVEAVALFPRLHVSHVQNTGPGSGPRAPPRNKMALYEQITLPSKRTFSALMSSSSATGGSIALQGHYSQSTLPGTSPAQGHGVASPSQWVWSSHLEFPAHHMFHKGEPTPAAMMGKRRQLGSDLFHQGPVPTANANPYYSLCGPPLYRPFHTHQAHPHLQPLPFLIPFNGSDGMYRHPLSAPGSAKSAVDSDPGELQRVPGMPSVPTALGGPPIQGIVPSQSAWPPGDRGEAKTAVTQDFSAGGGRISTLASGLKASSGSQPVRKGQKTAGMTSGTGEATPAASRVKGAASKGGSSSMWRRRAAREEEDGCVVPSIEMPASRSRDGSTAAVPAASERVTSALENEGAGGVLDQEEQPNAPELLDGEPLARQASVEACREVSSSGQALVVGGVGRARGHLAEACEEDVRPPGIVPIGIDPAVEGTQDSDRILSKGKGHAFPTSVSAKHMSRLTSEEMVSSPSDNYLPLMENDEVKTMRIVPTGVISDTEAGCSKPTDVDDRSMDWMEGKVKYSETDREGSGEEMDPLHKNKKKKRDSSSEARGCSDAEENSSYEGQLPSAIRWDEEEDNIMRESADGNVWDTGCCVIMPMDVVKSIGQKAFWNLRKTILRQQRIFSSQVAELHRLVKVQRMLAADPSTASMLPEPTDENHLRAKEILMKNAYATRDKVFAAIATAAATCTGSATIPVQSKQFGLEVEAVSDDRERPGVKNRKRGSSSGVGSCAAPGALAYAAQQVGRECSKAMTQRCDEVCSGRLAGSSCGLTARTTCMPPPVAPVHAHQIDPFPPLSVPAAVTSSEMAPPSGAAAGAAAGAVGMTSHISMLNPPSGSPGAYYPKPHHSGILLPAASLQWYAASSAMRAVGFGPQAAGIPPAVGSAPCLWQPGTATSALGNNPHGLAAHYFQPFAPPAAVGAAQYHPYPMVPTGVSPVPVPMPGAYTGGPAPLAPCPLDRNTAVAAASGAASAARIGTIGGVANLPSHLTSPMTLVASASPAPANAALLGLLASVEMYPPYTAGSLHAASAVASQQPWCSSQQQPVMAAAAATATMNEQMDPWYMMHPGHSKDMMANGRGQKGTSGSMCGLYFDFPTTSRERPRGKEKVIDRGMLAPKDGQTRPEDSCRSGKAISEEDDDDCEQEREEERLLESCRWVNHDRLETFDEGVTPPPKQQPDEASNLRALHSHHTLALNVSGRSGRTLVHPIENQELSERASEASRATTYQQSMLQVSNHHYTGDVEGAQRPREEANNRTTLPGAEHGMDKHESEGRGWRDVEPDEYRVARLGNIQGEAGRKGGSTSATPLCMDLGIPGETTEKAGLLLLAAGTQYPAANGETSQCSSDSMALHLGHLAPLPHLPALLSSLHPGALAAAHTAVRHPPPPPHHHNHHQCQHTPQQHAALPELCPPLPLLLQAHHSSIMAHPCKTSSPSLVGPALPGQSPGPAIRPIKVVPTKAVVARPESTAGILQSLQYQREQIKK